MTGDRNLTVKWQWGSLWAANWCHCQLLCSSRSFVHCEPERMSPICSYKTLTKLYRNCILITSPRQIDLSIVGYLWIISDKVIFKMWIFREQQHFWKCILILCSCEKVLISTYTIQWFSGNILCILFSIFEHRIDKVENWRKTPIFDMYECMFYV